MKASDELRYDHEVLRAKLLSLELSLPASQARACTLSRLTDSLASCLRSHVEREEHLLAARALRYGEPPAECLQHLHDEHENQRTRLAILHDLLTHPEPAAEDQIVTQASYLVKDLREHMVVEERRVFPVIDGEVVSEATTAVDEETVEMLGLA